MLKTAQKRSVLNKIREMSNIPGAAVENFFEPEMKRVMNSLREADDNIRSIITGQKIGESTIDITDPTSLKDLLKDAKSNFNRREYMIGVADLGKFHKRMYDVSKYIDTLSMNVDQIHNNFLFQGIGDKEKDKLNELRQHMSSVALLKSQYFIKEAGIMDFFYNIGTQRGRALAAWEKRYPNVVKNIRDNGIRLLSQAESVLSNTISLLKEMATARATRKVDSYITAADKIKKEYFKFDAGDKGFKSYYTNIIQPFLKKFDELENAKIENNTFNTSKIVDAPINTPIQTNQVTNIEEAEPTANVAPEVAEVQRRIREENINKQKEALDQLEKNREIKEKEEIEEEENQSKYSSHKSFFKTLEKLSNESPIILHKYIIKYAKSIQDNDPESAIKLFDIARQLKR